MSNFNKRFTIEARSPIGWYIVGSESLRHSAEYYANKYRKMFPNTEFRVREPNDLPAAYSDEGNR